MLPAVVPDIYVIPAACSSAVLLLLYVALGNKYCYYNINTCYHSSACYITACTGMCSGAVWPALPRCVSWHEGPSHHPISKNIVSTLYHMSLLQVTDCCVQLDGYTARSTIIAYCKICRRHTCTRSRGVGSTSLYPKDYLHYYIGGVRSMLSRK